MTSAATITRAARPARQQGLGEDATENPQNGAHIRQCLPAPSTRVVVLTTFDVDSHVYDALRAGASGFLLKNAPPEDLVHAIRVAALVVSEATVKTPVTRLLAKLGLRDRVQAVVYCYEHGLVRLGTN